jgi:hypothetical protein
MTFSAFSSFKKWQKKRRNYHFAEGSKMMDFRQNSEIKGEFPLFFRLFKEKSTFFSKKYKNL